jgi:hypothetical protein
VGRIASVQQLKSGWGAVRPDWWGRLNYWFFIGVVLGAVAGAIGGNRMALRKAARECDTCRLVRTKVAREDDEFKLAESHLSGLDGGLILVVPLVPVLAITVATILAGVFGGIGSAMCVYDHAWGVCRDCSDHQRSDAREARLFARLTPAPARAQAGAGNESGSELDDDSSGGGEGDNSEG